MAYVSVVQFDFCNKNHIKRGSMLMARIAGCSPLQKKLYIMWICVWAQKLNGVILSTGGWGIFVYLSKLYSFHFLRDNSNMHDGQRCI